jgi:hypothetical protein
LQTPHAAFLALRHRVTKIALASIEWVILQERFQRGVEERGDQADFAHLVKALFFVGDSSDAHYLALLAADHCGSDAAHKDG